MKNRLNLLDLLIPAVETKVDPCLHPPGKNQMQRAALENMFHICPHKKNGRIKNFKWLWLKIRMPKEPQHWPYSVLIGACLVPMDEPQTKPCTTQICRLCDSCQTTAEWLPLHWGQQLEEQTKKHESSGHSIGKLPKSGPNILSLKWQNPTGLTLQQADVDVDIKSLASWPFFLLLPKNRYVPLKPRLKPRRLERIFVLKFEKKGEEGFEDN